MLKNNCMFIHILNMFVPKCQTKLYKSHVTLSPSFFLTIYLYICYVFLKILRGEGEVAPPPFPLSGCSNGV